MSPWHNFYYKALKSDRSVRLIFYKEQYLIFVNTDWGWIVFASYTERNAFFELERYNNPGIARILLAAHPALSWTLQVFYSTDSSYLRIVWRYFTLSTNPMPCHTITISMVLKFFSHLKHLPRLVLGLTAVWNSLHKGQRKRKKPSLVFDGIANSF